MLLGLLAMSGGSGARSETEQRILSGTSTRYTVSLPPGHAARPGAPLVVSLHYGGTVSPWYGRGLLEQVVQPALRSLSAVMVAPDCAAPAWVDCADILAQVIEQVQRDHATDPSCVILTGYSKGGIGAWALAGQAPQRYAAAVVMAARAPEEAALAQWRTPVRVIHGADDELFPGSAVSSAVSRLAAAGVDAELELLEGVTHYDTHRFVGALARQATWLEQRCDRR